MFIISSNTFYFIFLGFWKNEGFENNPLIYPKSVGPNFTYIVDFSFFLFWYIYIFFLSKQFVFTYFILFFFQNSSFLSFFCLKHSIFINCIVFFVYIWLFFYFFLRPNLPPYFFRIRWTNHFPISYFLSFFIIKFFFVFY